MSAPTGANGRKEPVMTGMVEVVTDRESADVPARADTATGALWMAPAEVERLLGWTLKSEGLCREDVCVPLPAGTPYLRDGAIDIAGLWRRLRKPVLATGDAGAWFFGEDAAARTAALESLQAPDFTLPDLSGRAHSLVDYRGRKRLLATWASW